MSNIDNFKGNRGANGLDRNPENINREGRPRKIYSILKEKGYSSDDIKTAFNELAWYKLDELRDVAADPDKPIIAKIIANQFVNAYLKADYYRIKEILEHVIGKPQQVIQSENDFNMNVDPFAQIRLNNGIGLETDKNDY